MSRKIFYSRSLYEMNLFLPISMPRKKWEQKKYHYEVVISDLLNVMASTHLLTRRETSAQKQEVKLDILIRSM